MAGSQTFILLAITKTGVAESAEEANNKRATTSKRWASTVHGEEMVCRRPRDDDGTYFR